MREKVPLITTEISIFVEVFLSFIWEVFHHTLDHCFHDVLHKFALVYQWIVDSHGASPAFHLVMTQDTLFSHLHQ